MIFMSILTKNTNLTHKTLASDEKNVILNIVHIHLSRNPNVVCLIGKAIPSLSRVSFPGAI